MTINNKSRMSRNSGWRFALATLLRPALRPAALQDQVQVLAVWSSFSNWILRYDAAVVFHIYIQVRTRNHAVSQLAGFSQSDLIEADDRCHCQRAFAAQHLFFFSGQSAAIDEVPDHMTNFSDVGVCRDVIAIRQHKSRKQLRDSSSSTFCKSRNVMRIYIPN